jgi:hypothetical protein
LKYTKESAIEKVLSKKGVSVSQNESINKIDLGSSKEQIGNGTWGAIDFLTKNHKYVVIRYPKSLTEKD